MSTEVRTADDFYAELTTRNTGFVSAELQRSLRAARVLVAGCGSTGGAVIEPLARIGVGDLTLADNGSYELNNLNRQHALLADLDRNKAVVGAERITAINPDARVMVHVNGIQPATVDAVVRDRDVIIDGVDVTEKAGLAAKWALHVSAAAHRVPVISGYDMAGTQYVRCYDYRSPRPPLDGAITAADLDRLSTWRLLDRIIPRRSVPVEMIRQLRTSLREPEAAVSQLIYTSLLFGAVATRMTVDLIDGRHVRRHVTIDVHRAVRRRTENAGWALIRPVELVRTLRSL